MKVSLRNIYKKLEKAGAKRESMDNKSPSGSLTIKLPATGSKRKASSDASGEEIGEAPKAKRGRPNEKANAEEE